MEILSYFPLAKLETITERTFINFSTTFCRNVRKQLHQKWLTVLITRASLANFKLYRFSSFKTLRSMIFFLLFFSWLSQYSTFSSKVSDYTGSVAHRHFTTSGRICTVWSCILLGKNCFLQIAQLCLSWIKFNEIHNLQSNCICQSDWIHYTDINSSCCVFLLLSSPVRLFSFPLFSPHALSLTSSLRYTMHQSLSHNVLYIFWQKQVEQYTSPFQTCNHRDARRLGTK